MLAIIKLDYPIERDFKFFSVNEVVIEIVRIRHVMMKDLIGLNLTSFSIEDMKKLIERTSNLSAKEVEQLGVSDYLKLQDFLSQSMMPKKLR